MLKEKSKKNAKIFEKRLIKYVLIPLSLVLFWLGFTISYIIYFDSSFTLISHVLPSNIFTHLPSGKLQKGDYLSGKFVGNDNNLGIVSLRFQTFFRPAYQNEDHLLFQIKEEGKKDWYYQSVYRVGTIYDVPFFPFGFPIIPNSKDKKFEFKITSLNGNVSNSVAISKRWQNITAKYKFTKQELLQSKTGLLQFSIEKFISSILTIDVLFSSLVYILPLFFYLILISPFEKHLRKPTKFISKKLSRVSNSRILTLMLPTYKTDQRNMIIIADTLLIGAVLLDGFYLQLNNSFVYLLVPILWILTQMYNRFTSKKTFIVAITFLLLPFIFQLIGQNSRAENMAVWAFLFLLTATVQSTIEIKKLSNSSP